jgi:asparagine synthetase B (glutamine-hydrolysing)
MLAYSVKDRVLQFSTDAREIPRGKLLDWGETLYFRNGRLSVTQIPLSSEEELEARVDYSLDMDTAATKLKDALFSAVFKALDKNPNMALTFSGGTDTFLIAAAAREWGANPPAYLYATEATRWKDEASVAKVHAEILGIKDLRVIDLGKITEERFEEAMEMTYACMAAPHYLSFQSGIAVWLMLQDATDCAGFFFGSDGDTFSTDYSRYVHIARKIPKGYSRDAQVNLALESRVYRYRDYYRRTFGLMSDVIYNNQWMLGSPHLVSYPMRDRGYLECLLSIPPDLRLARGDIIGADRAKVKVLMRYIMKRDYPGSLWDYKKMWQEMHMHGHVAKIKAYYRSRLGRGPK